MHDDYNEMYHVDNHLDQLDECEPEIKVATVAGELFLVSHDHWSELNETLHGEVRALGDDKEKGDEVVLGDDLV